MVKQQMPLEKYRSDDLSYILGREKKIAINYFIAHDDFPMGYEELMISRSKQAVTQGLEELRENLWKDTINITEKWKGVVFYESTYYANF